MGLTIARELKRRMPGSSVGLLEKEADVAWHASGRNSGVLHAGFYYSASSLKARFAKAGNLAMARYCEENGLKLNRCGKLVVAANEDELMMLEELKKRADDNGVQLEWVDEKDLQRIDPNARTCRKALYSPNTATVDPYEVCQHLKNEIVSLGVGLHLNCPYRRHEGQRVYAGKWVFECGYLINTAGLYADRIARDFGFAKDYTILPFKGLYMKYEKNNSDAAVNIYPVPSRHHPFLGVHFTKCADFAIKIGPTAVPAFWRENYSGLARFRPGEMFTILPWLVKLWMADAFHFRSLAIEEFKKYRKRYLIGLAEQLVRQIDRRGFRKHLKPGIRAQLLHKKSLTLVQDFVVEGDSRSIHVLNAVSPAFTCSLPFSSYVVDLILQYQGKGDMASDMSAASEQWNPQNQTA
jgi:L-2-hydroxyglutarate oxidase LhgO